MTLAPLINAPFAIQIHAFAAITAFAVGLIQLTAPKGTIPHRLIGWSWAVLMLTVAISSLFTPRNPPMGSVEPDPPVVDLDLGIAAARGLVRPSPRCEASSI